MTNFKLTILIRNCYYPLLNVKSSKNPLLLIKVLVFASLYFANFTLISSARLRVSNAYDSVILHEIVSTFTSSYLLCKYKLDLSKANTL